MVLLKRGSLFSLLLCLVAVISLVIVLRQEPPIDAASDIAQMKSNGVKSPTRGSDDLLRNLAEAHLALNEKAQQLSDSTFQLTLAQSSLKEKANEVLSLKMQLSKAQEDNWEVAKKLDELREQEQLTKSEKQELEKKLQELQGKTGSDVKASVTTEKEVKSSNGRPSVEEDNDDARAARVAKNGGAARRNTPTKSEDDGRAGQNLEMSNISQQNNDKDDFVVQSLLPDSDPKAEEHRQFVKQV